MTVLGIFAPMLAETAPGPFDSDRHVFEIKWDGYRALAHVTAGACTFYSRHAKDLTPTFPALRAVAASVRSVPAILDGEIVAFDHNGRPSFSRLRRGGGPVVYMAFDLLVTGGEPVMDAPWHRRRALLEEGMEPGEAIQLSPVVKGAGRALYRSVVERGLEGMMAKEMASPYLPGRRSGYWLKVRNVRTLDCVIAGVTAGKGRALGALVLACYLHGELVSVGQVGTGFSEAEAGSILARLRARVPQPKGSRGVLWVEPQLVCSVEYLEFTPDLQLRHPVFRGIRPDVDPQSCRLPGWEEGEYEEPVPPGDH
ncbi:MAG: non-homologous end-joining DNA ligase [Bacillota bacterium]